MASPNSVTMEVDDSDVLSVSGNVDSVGNILRVRQNGSAISQIDSILELLIRSGRVNGSSSGDFSRSSVDSMGDMSCKHVTVNAGMSDVSTTNTFQYVDGGDFSVLTQQSCGMNQQHYAKCQRHLVEYQKGHRKFQQSNNILNLLSAREVGLRKNEDFSHGNRCWINSHYLPNDIAVQDKYPCKAFCGMYSSDGSYFLSACQDRYLRIYDTTGPRFKLKHAVRARDVGWSILDTAFSPDDSCIVYSSWSLNLHLVRLNGDVDLHETLPLNPYARRFCVFALVFSNDGREILCGSNDGYLFVYNLESNKRHLRIQGHDDDVNSVAFADNTSHILYSGGDDGFCKVWDLRTLSEAKPKPVGVLAGHMDGVTFIEPRGDGRYFLSNSKDQTIKLWDVRKFSDTDAQEETRKAVREQNWDYRWQKIPSRFNNSKLRLKGDTSVMTYRGHSVMQTLIRCRFSPAVSTGQRYIYTGCAEGLVVVYDALTGEKVKSLFGHTACVRDVSWHPYKPEIASTSWDCTIGRWTYKPDVDVDDINALTATKRRMSSVDVFPQERDIFRGRLSPVSSSEVTSIKILPSIRQ